MRDVRIGHKSHWKDQCYHIRGSRPGVPWRSSNFAGPIICKGINSFTEPLALLRCDNNRSPTIAAMGSTVIHSHKNDESKQLPGLQNAFPQGRGGKKTGSRTEKTGSRAEKTGGGTSEASRGERETGRGKREAGRGKGEAGERTQPTHDFWRVHPTLSRSSLAAAES